MTHTAECGSKLSIIVSDHSLSPDRCQANIWTSAGILLTGFLKTYFSGEILIDILTFSSKKMRLRVSPVKWGASCLGLNVTPALEACLFWCSGALISDREGRVTDQVSGWYCTCSSSDASPLLPTGSSDVYTSRKQTKIPLLVFLGKRSYAARSDALTSLTAMCVLARSIHASRVLFSCSCVSLSRPCIVRVLFRW